MRFFVVLLLLSVSTGCSSFFMGRNENGEGVRLSQIRGEDTAAKSYRVKMSRKVIERALEHGSVEDIRIVRIQRSMQSLAQIDVPEYRIFSLRERGPYRTLGLKNGDVLVAVEDYIVFDPWRFKRYVQMLPSQESAQIQIRRYGRPVILNYTFVD